MNKKILFNILAVFLIFTSGSNAQGIPDREVLQNEILRTDSLFWITYDQCDIQKMRTFFTDDIEFYHDKSGPIFGLETFMEETSKGLCGNPDWRLRREAVPGTVHIYPMQSFGAIMIGEHVFYINEKGKDEYLDGRGNFIHLWKFENEKWKMSRVYSYDHRPALITEEH